MTSLHLSQFRKWFLQSPPVEWGVQQLRDLLIGSIRQGPVPEHIAFVMDGNRRFARKNKIETVEGHNLGFEALARILEVCYKSGVRVVTIYAFSIENFKRSKYEVDALMDIAKVKLSQMAQHGDLCERYGCSIRVLGQRDLLKPDVVQAIDKAVDMTDGYGRAILNVCFPYTSRDEMTTAIRETVNSYSRPSPPRLKRPFSETHIARNIRAQSLSTVTEHMEDSEGSSRSPSRNPSPNPSSADDQPQSDTTSTTLNSDAPNEQKDTPEAPQPEHHRAPSISYPDAESITPATITSHMFTAGMPPLDILIRTSGVERLSDFMLWQCHEKTDIVFLKTLWPELDLWQFLPVLVDWQWSRKREKGDGAKKRIRVRGAVEEEKEKTS